MMNFFNYARHFKEGLDRVFVRFFNYVLDKFPDSLVSGSERRLLKFYKKDSKKNAQTLEGELVEYEIELDSAVSFELGNFKDYSLQEINDCYEHYARIQRETRELHTRYRGCFLFESDNLPDYDQIKCRLGRIFMELSRLRNLKRKK